MTPSQKRELKKRGKLIVEQRWAVLHGAHRQAIPNLSIEGFKTAKANEEWLREHYEQIPAAEVSRRFIVTLTAPVKHHAVRLRTLSTDRA